MPVCWLHCICGIYFFYCCVYYVHSVQLSLPGRACIVITVIVDRVCATLGHYAWPARAGSNAMNLIWRWSVHALVAFFPHVGQHPPSLPLVHTHCILVVWRASGSWLRSVINRSTHTDTHTPCTRQFYMYMDCGQIIITGGRRVGHSHIVVSCNLQPEASNIIYSVWMKVFFRIYYFCFICCFWFAKRTVAYFIITASIWWS